MMMLPTYVGGDQQSDFFSNDQGKLGRNPPPHFSSTQNWLHTYHNPHQDAAHNLDAWPMNGLLEMVNNPGATLHFLAPAEPFNAGESSDTRANFLSSQDNYHQMLQTADDPIFNVPNIGNYITSFSLPILSMDGVSTFPKEFKDKPEPLREPLLPPVAQNHGGLQKKHCFLFHPYSYQPGNHESQASDSLSELPIVQSTLAPIYNKNNSMHKEIVQSALNDVIDHVINVYTLLDRKKRRNFTNQAVINAIASICSTT
ncbi:hypothetical protein BD769DRAFT_1388146 [Suillus cothurnatus]|nr:hypothetical protein BD769DRAFT_1388146 [Suillus cothurnatus]